MLSAPKSIALLGSTALFAWILGGCAQEVATSGGASEEGPRSLLKERAAVLDPREHRIGRRIPDLGTRDLEGRTLRLSEVAAGRSLVILLRDVGCPVSKRIGPDTHELEASLAGEDVAFLYLNVSPHNTAKEMRGEIEQFGFEGRYAHDPRGELARALGATTTTEVFLLDPALTLVYRGCIDDRVGRGTARQEASNHYLAKAVEAVREGYAVAVPATSAPGCLLEWEEDLPTPPTAEITYHDQVSRILQRNCVECHRDGGAAPFSLETYEQARGRRGMVKFTVAEGIMPPWFASDGTGPWENDRRLSDTDKETLLEWYAQGAPEGDPADAPAPRTWREGWMIGEPDLVFRIPEPFEIPATGVVDLTKFFIEEVVPEDIWVQRMQVLPTDPSVVHHATAMFKPPDDAYSTEQRILNALVPWNQSREGWQFLLAYLPGKDARIFADGVARFVPKGSVIRIEMHYTPNGVATEDQTSIGMVLADGPPEFAARTRMIRNPNVFVPAGEPNAKFYMSYSMAARAYLRSLTPHMHLRGKSFEVSLVYPDGTQESALEIEEWDPDWQFTYTFREPRLLDVGTRIQVEATFDNSWENPNNPDADVDVIDGPQIWDEMMILVAEWISPNSAN